MSDIEKEKEWLLRDKYEGRESEDYFEDVKRLENGEPLGYVIGWTPFLGCKIDLGARPLIPRPETEHWTNIAISTMKESPGEIAVLDMFAGSGCVGTAVLKHIPNSHLFFGEKETRLSENIEKNLTSNNINPSRARVLCTDLFSHIPKSEGGSFDYILANPPYISDQDSAVEKSVVDFEPHSALFAGRKGLDLIEPFLAKAPDYLKAGGKLYMEFGKDQERVVKELAEQAGFKEVEIHNDQFGTARFLIATKS